MNGPQNGAALALWEKITSLNRSLEDIQRQLQNTRQEQRKSQQLTEQTKDLIDQQRVLKIQTKQERQEWQEKLEVIQKRVYDTQQTHDAKHRTKVGTAPPNFQETLLQLLEESRKFRREITQLRHHPLLPPHAVVRALHVSEGKAVPEELETPALVDNESADDDPDSWEIAKDDSELMEAWEAFCERRKQHDLDQLNHEEFLRSQQDPDTVVRLDKIQQLKGQADRITTESKDLRERLKDHEQDLHQGQVKLSNLQNRARQQRRAREAKQSIVNPYVLQSKKRPRQEEPCNSTPATVNDGEPPANKAPSPPPSKETEYVEEKALWLSDDDEDDDWMIESNLFAKSSG